MLKSNFLDLLRIDESLKVDDLWIALTSLLPGRKEESCGTVSANCVPDNGLEGIIDVVAG